MPASLLVHVRRTDVGDLPGADISPLPVPVVAHAMGKQSNFFLPSEVFARLASSHKSFAGLSYDRIGFKGLPVVDAPQKGPKTPIAVGAA